MTYFNKDTGEELVWITEKLEDDRVIHKVPKGWDRKDLAFGGSEEAAKVRAWYAGKEVREERARELKAKCEARRAKL
ncbi:hypothetical protein [Endozoicomonas sp. 4G]|uniref:hypothetical protein n=1 Tax=Endozoicomonas sp. 4G TaxID=2872754 RepID=UPI0020790D6C|nr:hypothetical protein [Endozoicomonas sp. 4G]